MSVADSGDIQVIRLDLLGPARAVVADRRSVDDLVRQTKRLALLVYLILHEGFVRRDTLLALGWPEASETAARRDLTQALHFLRRQLGPGVLENRGDDEIRVAPGMLSTDLLDFRRAVSESRFGDALALWRGEMMGGMHIPGCADFVQWRDKERERFHREAVHSACMHAASLANAGDLRAAEAAARRATEIDPADEAPSRLLIEILLRAGSRPAAIKAYRDYRDYLATEYDLEPSAEMARLVQGSTAGDPAEAPTLEPPPAGRADADPPIGVAETDPASLSRPSGPRIDGVKRNWRLAAIGAAVALTVAAGVVLRARARGTSEGARAAPSAPHRVAVLYLEPAAGIPDSLSYLAGAVTEAVIDELRTARDIDVISAHAVRSLAGGAMPAAALAERLSAETVVSGNLQTDGADVAVTMRVVRAADGSVRDVIRVRRPAGRPIDLAEETAAAIAIALRKTLGAAIVTERWKAGTGNARAWLMLERARESQRLALSFAEAGRFAEARRAYTGADSLLSRAAAEDPSWHAPHLVRAQIAESDAAFCAAGDDCAAAGTRGMLERSLEHVEEALRRSPEDPESLVQRGTLQFLLASAAPDSATVTVHLDAAERDLRAATARAPHHALAWSRLSAVLYLEGRFADAREAARVAYQTDAFLGSRLEVMSRLFLVSVHLEDDAEALRWCNEIQAGHPGTWPASFCRLCLLLSQPSEADPEAAWLALRTNARADRAAGAMIPRLELLVAAILARAGQPDSARVVLSRALAAGRADPEIGLFHAVALAALGEQDSTIAVLRWFLAGTPSARGYVRNWRWFRRLRGEAFDGDRSR
jgi:DNA-binding SARP family transcriptional activator/TolB-like protein